MSPAHLHTYSQSSTLLEIGLELRIPRPTCLEGVSVTAYADREATATDGGDGGKGEALEVVNLTQGYSEGGGTVKSEREMQVQQYIYMNLEKERTVESDSDDEELDISALKCVKSGKAPHVDETVGSVSVYDSITPMYPKDLRSYLFKVCSICLRRHAHTQARKLTPMHARNNANKTKCRRAHVIQIQGTRMEKPLNSIEVCLG